MNRRSGWFRTLAAALCLCALLGAPRALAAGGEAKRVTGKCAFKVSEGSADKLTDGRPGSVWSYSHKDGYVGIRMPKGVEAGWLQVEWLYDPTAYELIEFDEGMTELRRRDQSCTFPNICSMYELLPETRYLQLKLNAKNQSISDIAVYSSGTLPEDVQVWNPPVEKADLMVVSTHQDDELVFLGGTIPYYAVALKKPTVVVYMTNCARYRRAEALNALWKMGVRDYPDFINFEDKKVGSINAGIRLWGGKDNILSNLAARIRRYKPEVIVTQDLNGEYGHNQHKVTARAMKYAIDAAADPAQYPESAERYGAWQVKKLYHHLYKENQITMDWETKLDSLNGYSPLQVAKIGMKEHSSQTDAYAVKSHGTYDNSKFGLYFTTVGEDVEKNDFLEHIDPDASAKYLEEHADEIAARAAAAAAATPPPEADEEEAEDISEEEMPEEAEAPEEMEAEAPVEAPAEVQPTAAPAGETAPRGEPLPIQREGTPAAAPKPTAERGGSAILPIAMIGLGVAAIGAGGWYAWRTLGAGKRRRRRRR